MTKARSDEERWNALIDALSDDVANMPEEQLLREFSDTEPEGISKTRAILSELVGDSKVAPHELARAALERHRTNPQQPALPATPEERRNLLQVILLGNHPWAAAATLQFRELDDPANLSDEEIQGILEDLAELSGDDEV